MKPLFHLSATLFFLVPFAQFGMAEYIPDIVFDRQHTETCLKAAEYTDQKRKCIGQAAQMCMNESPDRHSTPTITSCTGAELVYWEKRLGAVLEKMKQDGSEAFHSMHQSWVTYRENRCGYERSFVQRSQAKRLAGTTCLLYVTAEYTLYLEGPPPGI